MNERDCNMGVGCDEAGICYASANGKPDMCGSAAREALRACCDYLDCIPESAAGGDDEALRLVKMARAALGD
jgi:hypothetical protein